jgi:anti-sigma regulatory factor (Ser/Thr protein kinase)
MDQLPTQERSFASVTVPSRVESIRLAAEFIIHAARNIGVPAAADSLFEVAVVEALNNAIKHGNTDQRADAFVVCEVEAGDGTLILRIIDQGAGYTLPRAARPDWSPDDIASVPESGYGLEIIQKIFPTVRTIGRPGQFGVEMTLTF